MYRELARSMSGTERAVSSSLLANKSSDSSKELSRSAILTVVMSLTTLGLENSEAEEVVVMESSVELEDPAVVLRGWATG